MRAQMRPGAPNMRLKGAQATPKTGPRGSKPFQNRARQAPRRVLVAIVLGRLVRKAPGPFFCDFSRCARCLRPVFRSIKTVVLLHSEQSESASAHAAQNLEKQGSGDSKTLLGPTWKPSKSSLERAKTPKKRPRDATNAARREKCAPEAPKSDKCANMVPTWRDLVSDVDNRGLP